MGSRYPKAFGHRNDLYSAALLYFYVPHHHFAFLISNFSFKRIFQTYSKDNTFYGRPLSVKFYSVGEFFQKQ